MTALLVVVYVAAGIAWVVAWAEIFQKTGYNRWLCFAMIVPVVNVVVFFWFAFSKWPVYEFVERGWHITKLKSQRERIERQIEELGGAEEKKGKVGAEAQSATVQGREVSRYVGDIETSVYHRLTCLSLRLIESKNMVFFPSAGEAKRVSYVPCQVCKPQN